MALDLQGAHALLGRGGTPEGIAPVPKGDAAILIHGPRPDAELLLAAPTPPAVVFLAPAPSRLHLVDVGIATVRASGVSFPPVPFQELHSREFIAAGRWDLGDCDVVLRRAVLDLGLHVHEKHDT